ncbi:MAG TPA: hypothetical protein VGB99_06765 [Acidobacteriota bacterium]
MRRTALPALLALAALAGPTRAADILVEARSKIMMPSPRIPDTIEDLRIFLGPEAALVEGGLLGTTLLRYDIEQAQLLTRSPARLRHARRSQRGAASDSPLRLQPMGETQDIAGIPCSRFMARGVLEHSVRPQGGRSGTALPQLELEIELWIGALPLVDPERLAHVLVHDPHFQSLFPFSVEQLAALPGVPIRSESRQLQLGRETRAQLELLSAAPAPEDPARFDANTPED